MIRGFVLAAFVVAGAAQAEAVTCDQVRLCVAQYGRTACRVLAIANGATAEQIRAARACLPKRAE